MKFMMLVKHPENSGPPPQALMDAIDKLSEEGVKSGALLGSGGLAPAAQSTRVRVSGGNLTVIDGPFAETKELIAGYWLIKVNSLQEAMEWAKRAPDPHGEGREGEIEIRQLFELDDFQPGEAIDRARELGKELAVSKK